MTRIEKEKKMTQLLVFSEKSFGSEKKQSLSIIDVMSYVVI